MLLVAAVLAGCATRPPPPTAVPGVPPPAAQPSVVTLPLSALPGWAEEDHAAALAALRAACQRARPEWAVLCPELRTAPAASARAWMEARLAC